ncbi:MAG: HesA/MoeB/ThiF family protein [Planctomycetes bacterium]|nr:HesA/MoeB/ThiF family protein [Planctomycetota bacterium]
MTGHEFTDDELERWSRNILLPEVGVDGQRKLAAARALVVGAGGLGSPAILYLAAAGVGTLGIADGDRVELSNLNRQVLHGAADVGRPKVESARDAVLARSPACRVVTIFCRLTARNVRQTVRGWDVVLDATDNFPARFLISDACWLERVPLVSAGVVGFQGQLLTVLPQAGSPCYRCLLPEPSADQYAATCGQAGVLGAAAGVLGAMQAVEAIKVLLGIGHGFERRLLVYDALAGKVRIANRVKDPACALCGPKATIADVVEYRLTCCPGGVAGPDGCCMPAAPLKRQAKSVRRRGAKGR